MLDAIEVRGFQSLADARIELGWLTVVEGPSNSGKSALVRALVMLARNARGTDYITTGKATCTVATGSAEEGFAVRLTRTARRGGDEYRVKVAEVPAAKVFTKLAGGVPEEVSALLRISELNIARQFDPPYLLTESGRDVAAVLGRLTNVSMVLAAAAEAGRRRKQLARDLKGAEQRRDDLLEQAQEFAGLAARRRALGRAEKALEALEATVASADRLRDLIGRVAGAEAAVEAARSAAARAEPPSLDALDGILARRQRLAGLIREHETASLNVRSFRGQAEDAAARETMAHRALHEALVAAGQCPLCGQAVA